MTSISPVWANQYESTEWLSQAADIVKTQESNLKDVTPETNNDDLLNLYLKSINPVKSQSQDCIAGTQTQLDKVTEDLLILGEGTAKDPAEVIEKRHGLMKQQKLLDTRLSSCKLLLLQSQDIIKSINEFQQNILAQQLSARTANIISALMDSLKTPHPGWRQGAVFLNTHFLLNLPSAAQLFFLLVLSLAGLFGGLFIRRNKLLVQASVKPANDGLSGFIDGLRACLFRSLPVTLPVLIAAVYLSIVLPLTPLPFLTKLSYILATYLGLNMLINMLLNPAAPARSYLIKTDVLSRRLAKQLKLLLGLALLGIFLFTGELKDNLSEPYYYLARSVFSVLFILNLISTLWLVRLFSWAMLSRAVRLFLIMLLVFSLLAELSGYRNLSTFVLGGLLATSISLALTLVIYRLLKDLCDSFDEDRLDWQATISERVGFKAGDIVPGLIWIRIFVFIGLWGGFAISALYIWRLEDPWLAIISGYLIDGFQLGSLKVTPTLLLGALLVFILIINFTRYIKKNILPQALKYTNLDRGAREAVASLAGYLGVTIAVLIGLLIAGVQMQNIAIIAGALSLGIGFGLQNIVNNFISGLILLFERPIRRGDWIVTGEIEGYVKAINIRSTQIETFDKADVIVPNSELITAKVTNWMLRDHYGRVSIPVGVSYESDVEKVHKVLLGVAEQHPMVVNEHSQISSPKVLLKNFGESSINFELRCFIYNIDQRMNVISEINYAIVAAFRREHIEMPYPQRVVTVVNRKDFGSENDDK